MVTFINVNGLEISDIIYGFDDYVVLKNTNRKYKIYHSTSLRYDASPYFNYKGKRYFLYDFIRTDI